MEMRTNTQLIWVATLVALATASAFANPSGECLPKALYPDVACDCTNGMFVADSKGIKGLVVCPHRCDEETRECLCPAGTEAVTTEVGKVCRESTPLNVTAEQGSWLALIHGERKIVLIDASFEVASVFETEKRIVKVDQLPESGRILLLVEESNVVHEVEVTQGRIALKDSGLVSGHEILTNFAYDERHECLALLSRDRARICLKDECTEWFGFVPERETRKMFFTKPSSMEVG